MNKYDAMLDIDSENSLSLLIKNIKENSTILEFGPATGRMTRYLSENMNCKVYIVEIDKEAYEKAMNYAVDGHLGDIESYEWVDKFKDIKFDYILFADVLEHLYSPQKVIKKASNFLKDSGEIGLSIPNIAHNSIIINLLRNNFQYNQLGLLDNTHIRFFAYDSVKSMLREAGLITVKEMATYAPETTNEFKYNLDNMTPIEKDALSNHEYGSVYQFVFMAVKEIYYDKNIEKIDIIKNIYNIKIPYSLKMYVNTGYGDRDCESIIKNFIYQSDSIKFDLSNFTNIKSLRCDFFVADKCILQVDEILLDGKNISVENLGGNQVFSHGNKYIFNTNNPYVYIMPDEKDIKDVTIKFSIDKIHDFTLLNSYLNEDSRLIEESKKLIEEDKRLINNYEIDNERLVNENKDIINRLSNEIDRAEKLEEKINIDKEELTKQIRDLNRKKIELERELQNKNNELMCVLNSNCWKITKPVRKVLDFTKDILKSNYYTNLFYKTLVYTKANGASNTYKKINSKLKKKNKVIYNQNFNDEVINVKDLLQDNKFNKKIAAHVHLYYVDLLDEFIGYLNNIPYEFDLFVSCKEGTDLNYVTSKLKTISKVNKVCAEITINRGRDIAPLYVQFGKRIEHYDYFLHVHTKKSLYSGKERYGWRQYSLDCLLGNKDVVKAIFNLFESDRKIGLFIPELYDDVPALALDWLANVQKGKEILNGLGIEFEDGIFTYPVGSFFWAKMDAVKPLFDYNFKYEDFPEEAGQTDGTTAHALERAIAFVSKSRGYEIAIHEWNGKNISFGRTLKPFAGYFTTDVDSVVYHLSQYELISFDIFDTLITRCVYKPDDVFNLMSRKIKQKYGLDLNFLDIRKRAEALAFKKNGEYCSINHIYNEMPKVSKITDELAMELMQMEIDTELSVCIPRRDVLKIFNRLKEYGKKIVLVSDMYLTKDIIISILDKCGYSGYDDLWISCEKGARKDSNTIWPLFFAEYSNYRTIHVGDNMRSDIQILGDQGKETFLILNPITEFKLSKNYSGLRKYIDTTVENSIMLGMMVNGGLYNSPFAIQVENAEPLISDDDQIGYIAFGAIFAKFINSIYKEHDKESILLFLAREGYLLEKLYNTFYNTIGKTPNKALYFLTSRRAATVSAISSEEDIRAILKQYYEGGLKNLLKSRLGIEMYDDMEECRISMPADEEKVIKMLKPHINEILDKAKHESQLYMEYIDDVLQGQYEQEISVVDVGYSGTIQFYLSKLLNKKISGYYLCTGVDRKPTRLGCKCEAVYQLDTVEQVENSKIFKGQLFLEAALQAPYGQLISFDKKDNELVPIFKDDNIVPKEITNLQEGIIEYLEQYFNITKDIIDDVEIDKNLAEDIFYDTLFKGDYSEQISNAFNVQDDYCSNGSQKFNKKEKRWVVE